MYAGTFTGSEILPMSDIDKSTVVQECRIFNDIELDSAKCCELLTKILYLVQQGNKFTSEESTMMFFGVTKLFQSKDTALRRLIYMAIKALANNQDEVIIVTSCLMKDMNGKVDIYRANAIRVLAGIMDASMMGTVERFLKQAIVDSNPFVASSALLAGTTLFKVAPDVIRRWVGEVQAAINDKNPMVQFHALGLLYLIKKNDRLAISKLVSGLARNTPRSPYAQVLLVRLASVVLANDANSGDAAACGNYMEACLRNKSDFVNIEAARAICNSPSVTPKELSAAVNSLQLFLTSQKTVLVFAAVRTLSQVAMKYPQAVASCNYEMEQLIVHTNRSIATLAITTLLKIGNENSIDRLMRQIGSFMSEIADEFKIVVVEAIQSLCLKFPAKHRSLMQFLASVLREEGGFDFKKSIVESVLILIREIPDAKEAGLGHLCEFIEDCEFTYLSVQILHVLGREGPTAADPTRYVRYVYNRVILENATVRAAAVSALAKFGVFGQGDLRDRVIVLLKRCLFDNDDEVRDRAMLSVTLLEKATPEAHSLLTDGLPVSFAAVEKSLENHVAAGANESFLLANVRDVPTAAPVSQQNSSQPTNMGNPLSSGSSAGSQQDKRPAHLVLHGIPELAGMGKCFKSSPPIMVTEAETEYVVVCTKHVFKSHIVFQFNVTNTIENTCLESACMMMETGDDGFEEHANVPCTENLMCNTPGDMFVAFAVDETQPVGAMNCTLKFIVKDVDETTGEPDEDGYEDEYEVEPVEITAADYLRPSSVPDFRQAWTAMEEPYEVREQFKLDAPSLQDGVTGVVEKLGLAPCEGTHRVAEGEDKHDLLCSGIGMSGAPVLVRAALRFAAGQGCQMRMMARSQDADLAAAVATLLQ